MKGKKLLSTVMAGTLAVTMAMPVMAADGGTVDVDVTTKTGVLRVEVPTSMGVAVDQFEITKTGTQLASGTFDMTNKSEMDVKISVTSEVTLANGISLASAKENLKGNTAWLAAAAMTAAGSYDDLTTDNGDTEAGTSNTLVEDEGSLTEKNANVTTFSVKDSKNVAEQTFYLAKGTGDAEYKLALADGTSGKVDDGLTYALFYELTALGTQPTDDDEVVAAAADNDLYVATAAAEGTAMTKIEKGDSTATFTTGGTYYTASDTAKKAADMVEADAGKMFVYASMDTDGGKAGFTYIGKLSEEKETWTSDDISAINIAYTIVGVTSTTYDKMDDDCTFGLYVQKNKNVVETDGTNDIVIYYAGDKPANVVLTPVNTTGTTKTAITKAAGAEVTIDDEKVTLKASWMKSLIDSTGRGAGTYKVTVNDEDTTITLTK